MSEVIWVVSDVHLGGSNSNHKEFADFLEWVAGKSEFEIRGSTRTALSPTKLILLGDFLELWDPIDDDFKNTALHLFESLEGLFKVAGEVVLVTGNHDEALETYEALDKKGNNAGYPITKPRFRIISRRYTPDNDPRYFQVGDKKYFFIHGHEFDRSFRFFGKLSRLPGLMAALNNTLMPWFPPKGWGTFVIFFALLVIRLLNLWPQWLPQGLLYIMGALSVPRLFTYLQTHLWRRFGRYLTDRPKHKDIEELISKGYYDRKKDTITADVVIYGHTHVPEISKPGIAKSIGKTLVNTGSWVSDPNPTEKNTLVVIDKEGALLLKWEGKKGGFSLLDSFPTRE